MLCLCAPSLAPIMTKISTALRRQLALIAIAITPLSAQVKPKSPAAAKPASDIAALVEGKSIHGFTTRALYLDAANRPMGARFTHDKTGFVLDVVREQSVPQAHIWVTTFPTTDRGEPHTQEHLLITKGGKGRALGTLASASLATTGAFTDQWRTNYTFNTAAGAKAFYTLVDAHLDALLNPDFTDEEVRREVRSFGITEDPATHALGLEEKGSVYNEMVSTEASPSSPVYEEMMGLIYGREHPLARNSGGTPAGIRELGADAIRTFHREHYMPGNMGMIVAVPDAIPLDGLLGRISASIAQYDHTAGDKAAISSMEDLPKAAPAAEGTIRIVNFPHKNPGEPSPLLFGWPANRTLSVNEQSLLGLYLDAVAGDATSNLYKRFIDTKTRTTDIGAHGVSAWLNDEPSVPFYISFDGVDPKHVNDTEIAAVRSAMLEELRAVAALPDGSQGLQAFNARIKSRIQGLQRAQSKFVNSPPRFGFRNTYSEWLDQLRLVNRTPGFRKSLVLAQAVQYADSMTNGPINNWRTLLPRWHVTDVIPYAVAGRPDSAMIERDAVDRRARAAAEVARLRSVYAVNDDQVALQRYKTDYEKNTAVLDELAATLPPSRLADDLPLTLDDPLQFRTDHVRGVPIVSSTFESMTSLTAGLNLRTDGVRDDELVYLSALPAMLTQVGLYKNDKVETFEEMTERQRREILSLSASWTGNPRLGRVELALAGAGNNPAESARALEWMRDVLTVPDWRAENLPRMRDVVDRQLNTARSTRQGAPETWVRAVSGAYEMQSNPRFLATSSFLTRTHFLLRLKWLLRDAGDASHRAALDEWFTALLPTDVGMTHAIAQRLVTGVSDTSVNATDSPGVKAFFARTRALPSAVQAIATDISHDLAVTLAEIPNETLAADWVYLVNQLRDDLMTPPSVSLAALTAMRNRLLSTGNARMFIVSSSANRIAVAPGVAALLGVLRVAPPTKAVAASVALIDQRLATRMPAGAHPQFVGLLDPNMSGGVMMNSAPSPTYADTSERALVRVLAGQLYGGGGAHSIYSQTIAAGLAYGNGLGQSAYAGRLSYYADLTPELPQTLSFVVGQLKKSPHDTALVDYAMTQLLHVRTGGSFEGRGFAIAEDLTDGITPDVVRRFNQKALALRKNKPDLAHAMYAQMDSVYAEVLPGYRHGMPNVPGAVYFTIGSEKQQAAYERYLKAEVSPDAQLVRLYPRDFWIVTPRKVNVP